VKLADPRAKGSSDQRERTHPSGAGTVDGGRLGAAVGVRLALGVGVPGVQPASTTEPIPPSDASRKVRRFKGSWAT
jgi:hypothetical protein